MRHAWVAAWGFFETTCLGIEAQSNHAKLTQGRTWLQITELLSENIQGLKMKTFFCITESCSAGCNRATGVHDNRIQV